MRALATTRKEAAMRQLKLGFMKEEIKAVALEPDVEKLVVTLMAQMIAEMIRQQETEGSFVQPGCDSSLEQLRKEPR
jgi:hypothetical protein